ncbi:MAG: hypothetical protein RLZZ511_2875 [Cyanobacteriota bacterium]|jgi:hypothetical protein
MALRGGVSVSDRIWSALVYALPIAAIAPYAGAFLQILPDSVQLLVTPVIMPLLILGGLYAMVVSFIPFGNFIVFLLLFMAVVRNPKFSHFLRYNTMQAMMIDIMITLVTLVFQAVNLSVEIVGSQRAADPLTAGMLYFFAAVFLVAIAACIYSLVHVVQGKYAEIKWVSEASYAQTRNIY